MSVTQKEIMDRYVEDPIRRVPTVTRAVACSRTFRETLDLLTAKGYDDLSIRQLRLLFAIQDAPASVRDLATALKLSKPAVTRNTDRLAEVLLVRKSKHKTDARLVRIELTSLGRKLVREIS